MKWMKLAEVKYNELCLQRIEQVTFGIKIKGNKCIYFGKMEFRETLIRKINS